jgi:hypothetical protein
MYTKSNKVQLNVYLYPDVYSKLENARGKMPRSTYIEDLLEKHLADVD